MIREVSHVCVTRMFTLNKYSKPWTDYSMQLKCLCFHVAYRFNDKRIMYTCFFE